MFMFCLDMPNPGPMAGQCCRIFANLFMVRASLDSRRGGEGSRLLKRRRVSCLEGEEVRVSSGSVTFLDNVSQPALDQAKPLPSERARKNKARFDAAVVEDA